MPEVDGFVDCDLACRADLAFDELYTFGCRVSLVHPSTLVGTTRTPAPLPLETWAGRVDVVMFEYLGMLREHWSSIIGAVEKTRERMPGLATILLYRWTRRCLWSKKNYGDNVYK